MMSHIIPSNSSKRCCRISNPANGHRYGICLYSWWNGATMNLFTILSIHYSAVVVFNGKVNAAAKVKIELFQNLVKAPKIQNFFVLRNLI